MESQTSLHTRYEVLFASAVIAAHANAADHIFRQRDVRFLFELFSNWIEHSIGASVIEVQNTQIRRYLEQLHQEGLCSKTVRGRIPEYKLSRIGVIDLLGRITATPQRIEAELNFFSLYFIRNYRERLWALVESEGKRFPIALRLEMEALLDYLGFAQRLLVQAETELFKLKVRIKDAFAASSIATRMKAGKHSVPEIASEIEREHPYELNSQKPLTELLSAIPENLSFWELETGSLRRANELWEPSAMLLETYHSSLKQLIEAFDGKNP